MPKTSVSRCGKGTRKLRGENEIAKWRQAKGETWRRGWESNPRIKVLQTSPLPLGYRALRAQYNQTWPRFQPGFTPIALRNTLLPSRCRGASRLRTNTSLSPHISSNVQLVGDA